MNNQRHQRLVCLTSSVLLSLTSLTGHAEAQAKASSLQTENRNIPSAFSPQDVQRFTNAISQVKHFYVKDVKDKDIFEGAIEGMLESLDPHSAFLDEEDFNDLKTSTQGEFGGLGIEVTMENSAIRVIAPIDDTPAKKAGVRSGDYIIRIDNKPVKGLKLRDAVKRMRGKQGTKTQLTILRKDTDRPLKIAIVRDIIRIKSVKSELFDEEFGYVRISNFQANTAKDFQKAIKAFKSKNKKNIKGLLLDLRDNPGGLLQSAIEISDALIHNDQKGDEELIVYTKGKSQHSNYEAVANPGDILKGKPIVVLINQGSASASEIVAGALQDNHRALIVGSQTFGKGSVQTILPLDDKHGIKLTTAFYYTPKGNLIQAKGLSPDIKLPENWVAQKPTEDENQRMKEADLDGHLENHLASLEGKQENTNQVPDKLKTDHQLSQAFNILKAMSLVKNS